MEQCVYWSVALYLIAIQLHNFSNFSHLRVPIILQYKGSLFCIRGFCCCSPYPSIYPPFTAFKFFLTCNLLQMIGHLRFETTRLRTGARVEGCNLLFSSINTNLFWVYLLMRFRILTAYCAYSCWGAGKATLWMAEGNICFYFTNISNQRIHITLIPMS
jgi:hypothetical protein